MRKWNIIESFKKQLDSVFLVSPFAIKSFEVLGMSFLVAQYSTSIQTIEREALIAEELEHAKMNDILDSIHKIWAIKPPP